MTIICLMILAYWIMGKNIDSLLSGEIFSDKVLTI